MGSDCISKYLYGLDLSMANTGIAIFDIDTYKPILITSISTNSKEEYGDRLHTQRGYMKDLIKKYPPYEVAIEKGFTMHNTSTQVIYRVHGVTQELFHEYKQFYYAPTTVKKAITGNGKSNKELVQETILKKYPNIKFDNEDQSDAVGVACCHLIKKHKMKW